MAFPDDRAKPDSSVQLSVIHFVDREQEKERGLTVEKLERLREVLIARFDAMDKAHGVAYTELQRRLDMLNHAHEEMVRDKEHFQSREGFQQFFEDYGKWRDSVNNTLSNQAGRTATWAIAIGIVFAILQILLRFWK
jgi:hypothetical protein